MNTTSADNASGINNWRPKYNDEKMNTTRTALAIVANDSAEDGRFPMMAMGVGGRTDI
jgi:hypothetical protein